MLPTTIRARINMYIHMYVLILIHKYMYVLMRIGCPLFYFDLQAARTVQQDRQPAWVKPTYVRTCNVRTWYVKLAGNTIQFTSIYQMYTSACFFLLWLHLPLNSPLELSEHVTLIPLISPFELSDRVTLRYTYHRQSTHMTAFTGYTHVQQNRYPMILWYALAHVSR